MTEKLRGAFVGREGGLRLGWRVALCVGAYLAMLYGVLYGLGAGFGALFNAWGLTTDNLYAAPLWTRRVVAWHTNFSYAMAYAASGWLGLRLAKSSPVLKRCLRIAQGIAWGLAIPVLMTLLALLLDSMRLENPLSEPRVSMDLMGAFLVLTLGKWSGEVLTKWLLFDKIRRCLSRPVAYAIVAVATLLLASGWTSVPAAVSSLLLGIVTCALYERGGLAMAAGMQCAWTCWTALIFGWPSMTQAVQPVYALYHVSDAWLTGGTSGMFAGWGSVIGLAGIAAWLLRREIAAIHHKWKNRREKNGKNSDCNRGSGFQRGGLLRQGAAGDAGSRSGRCRRRASGGSQKRGR